MYGDQNEALYHFLIIGKDNLKALHSDRSPIPTQIRHLQKRALSRYEPMDVLYSRDTDPIKAVRQCAKLIDRAHLPPQLVIAFCGGKHPPLPLLEALREELGPVPIVGGAAAGAITRNGMGYSGFEIALGVFGPKDVVPACVCTNDLLAGEEQAGAKLGSKVKERVGKDSVVMLLYDSIAAKLPLRLHPAAPLVEGFYRGLGSRSVHLIGAGLLTDLNLSDGWIYDGNTVRKHSALALVFPPNVRAHTVIMHGCRPVSSFMKITRIDSAEVFELDGKPALSVLEKMLGIELGNSDTHSVSLLATLGQKHGDPYAPFNEKSYVNRLILRTNRDAGSITIFEPDFKTGSLVQIMARDNELMLASVEQGMAEMGDNVKNKKQFLSFYIDCAGRASARSGSATEEASIAMKAPSSVGPILGFYSGVEIAPFGEKSSPLDWTAVFSTLYYD